MSTETTQISAFISEETSSELERYTDSRGLKKGYVIEQALRHHLRALRELPADVSIPARLVVSAKTGEHLAERMRKPRKPTPAMRALFAKK
ncbi:MAG: hypothetical protein E6J90_27230 [Deltaproteobacteria bacterium]|nr:MAG: hypothetical protein E6J90_27230 [Deltaproteobacteria bacterium]